MPSGIFHTTLHGDLSGMKCLIAIKNASRLTRFRSLSDVTLLSPSLPPFYCLAVFGREMDDFPNRTARTKKSGCVNQTSCYTTTTEQ